MDFFNEASNDTASSSSEKRAANESLRDELSKLEKRNKVNITVNMPPPSSSNTSGHQFPSAADNNQPSTSKAQPAPAASESSTRFDILQYWKKRKFSSPRLYRLAMVVLAAPSTQVTVERLFSQLKYILTDRRMQLYGVSVHDIMILKMNPDLLIEVVETLLEHHAI